CFVRARNRRGLPGASGHQRADFRLVRGLLGTAFLPLAGVLRALVLAASAGFLTAGAGFSVDALTEGIGSAEVAAGTGEPAISSTGDAPRPVRRGPRSSSQRSSFSPGQVLITCSGVAQARRAMPTPKWASSKLPALCASVLMASRQPSSSARKA